MVPGAESGTASLTRNSFAVPLLKLPNSPHTHIHNPGSMEEKKRASCPSAGVEVKADYSRKRGRKRRRIGGGKRKRKEGRRGAKRSSRLLLLSV